MDDRTICDLATNPPIFVHLLAQEYILYRSGGLSSISGEERESETAGECYLVVVKGCPGLTARHAAAPLHSTTHTVHTRLSDTACLGHRNYYDRIVSSSEEGLDTDRRETIVLFACCCSLTVDRVSTPSLPPDGWEGSPPRVSPC